jgi:LmbE family N-acetylglucosaminyl deacetylase
VVNVRLGAPAGSCILRRVGKTLKGINRQTAVAGRWSPGTTPASGLSLPTVDCRLEEGDDAAWAAPDPGFRRVPHAIRRAGGHRAPGRHRGALRRDGRAAGAVGRAAHLSGPDFGDKGSPDPLIDPRALGAIREAEQRAAAALLGVEDVVFLRYHDGEIADDLPTRAAVAAQIRRVRPDLLIAFDPWHDYTFHNDHRQAGLVALAAARVGARRAGPACGADGTVVAPDAPPHSVAEAWLFLTGQPNLVFDIAPTIEEKIAARLAHASQAADPAGVARGVRARAEATGAAHGLALAEAFHALWLPVDESLAARLAVGES